MPLGAGWALVGVGGYNKDPITALGIKDAFLDAERCASALHEAWSGSRSYDAALGDYQRVRDEQGLPMYEYTCQLATLEPPPAEMQQLFFAMQGNAAAMDGFAQVNAGTLSPAKFFAAESAGVQR
jgi:2-polyprenyl-6-methoxyphenol hydroxylase-like FAD-dependent oxidoreductase